jgi:capsular exopolysaccharide synthesis family protein
MINSLIADYNNLVLQRMKAVHNSNDQNSSTAQLDKELKELKTNILFSVASAKKGVQISLNDIVAKDNQFKSKVKNLPSQIRESRSIERQQKTKETLYLFLLQKQEELAVSLASETLPVKTIDRANASSIPVSPRRGIIMLLSLIIGGLIPIIYLYLKDLFNNKLENKEELKKKVSAPLLGFISQYSGAEKVVVRENSFSAVAEQFRLVRANLQFLLGAKKQSSVILVTSSISGEGKSFFAINLAMSLVLTKKKTILLDLDIRNPQLSNYLDIHNKSGISIFLSDESSKVTDIIYKSSTTNGLDIIPCGPIPPNPSELLMSERLELLFEELKKSYDYIIVDSAPVGIVSDTFIINKNVDVSVFVVREKYTPKDILPAVSELYEQKKLNNLSLVLNGIDERNANNYGKYYKAYNRRGK